MVTAAAHGGEACIGAGLDKLACLTQACPVNCTWNSWGVFSSCTKSCAGGKQTRSRTKIAAMHGGVECSGEGTETSDCETQKCPGPPYSMGVLNSNTCPIEYNKIGSKQLCEAAGDTFNFSFGASSSWDSFPTGCFHYKDGVRDLAYYNNDAVGAENALSRPICKSQELLGSTAVADNYHQECWTSGACVDNGVNVCNWCGIHEGRQMYCCISRPGAYQIGDHCHDADFGSVVGHHCVTPAFAVVP